MVVPRFRVHHVDVESAVGALENHRTFEANNTVSAFGTIGAVRGIRLNPHWELAHEPLEGDSFSYRHTDLSRDDLPTFA